MDQQLDKPIIIPKQYIPIKYFLSSLNTFFANTLVNRLKNDHLHPQNPNRILGSIIKTQNNHNIPIGVKKVIDTQKIKFFEDIILNSDVIIYDLNTCDPKQIEFVISTLKINNYTDQKILICVSNVMAWANSKPKQKKQGDQDQGDQNPPQEPDSQQQPDQANSGEDKKVYVRFTDKDYSLRKPSPKYQKIKSIETLCLAAGQVKPNLKTYVVCSGILYGCGEKIFAPYFLQARLQKPQSLPYFQKGKNRIPSIHLKDLVTYIQKIIERRPSLPYILAIDHNPKPTLKKIMQSISKGIGTGKIVSQPPDHNIQNIDILTINLRMKPTMFFAKLQQQQAAIEQQQGKQTPKFKFIWQSKQGIQKSIQKLCNQFNEIRGYSQQKVFIMGPPGSGKSHFAKIIAQKYYLPHLHIKSVIDEVKQLQTELGQQIRNYLNQQKQTLISAKQTQYDQLKQKMKKVPKNLRQPMQPFDPEKIVPRLSDQLIYKCYKWRLNRNDCLNRGYILDGYPKKYDQAKEIFEGFPNVQQGQQPEQNPKKILDQKLVPKKFIILEISDKQIMERIQQLPQSQIIGTHFNQKQIKRRLKIYRDLMNTNTGDLILQDYFKDNKINLWHVQISSQTLGILQSIIKPQPINQHAENKNVQERLKQQQNNRKYIRNQMTNKHQIIRDIQHQDYTMKKQNQQNQERQILDKKSLALRKYLDVNLVPILSQGIIQILKDFPDDPVDWLAQFLFKNSLKVPNPDPSKFEL